MKFTPIVDGVYQLALGQVNAYLLRGDDGLVLVDTGFPGSEGKVLQALQAFGAKPGELRHILLTHGHPDHTGSAGALARATGAAVYIHADDVTIARTGTGFRPLHPSPGLGNHLLFTMVHLRIPHAVEPVEITRTIADDEVPEFAGGLRAVHTPGHCAGQLAYLWPGSSGLLIAADSCMHLRRLGLTMAYEDVALGRKSLKKLAALDFKQAVFGHGKPLSDGAADAFRKAFA